MKPHPLLLMLLSFILSQSHAQTDTSTVYQNLETKKFYQATFSSFTREGKTVYTVNNKEVSEAMYRKYESGWENMETCCPCILQTYDVNEVLLREAVACTDCGVGTFKEFYPNGKLKRTGRYKENPTSNWKNIWKRGFCSVPDGQWTYFNEQGDTLYSEFWKNGELIKRVPAQ